MGTDPAGCHVRRMRGRPHNNAITAASSPGELQLRLGPGRCNIHTRPYPRMLCLCIYLCTNPSHVCTRNVYRIHEMLTWTNRMPGRPLAASLTSEGLQAPADTFLRGAPNPGPAARNRQLALPAIHRSGWMSSLDAEYHRLHPKTQSKRWYLPPAGEQCP